MPEFYNEHYYQKYYTRLLGLYGPGNIRRENTPDTVKYHLLTNNTVVFSIDKNNLNRQALSVTFNNTILPTAFEYQKEQLNKKLVKYAHLDPIMKINESLQKSLDLDDIDCVKKKEILVRCLQALNRYLTQVGLSYTGGLKTQFHKLLCYETKKLYNTNTKPIAIALLTLGVLCSVAAVLVGLINIGCLISGAFAPLSPTLFAVSAGLGVIGIGLFAKGAYSLSQCRKLKNNAPTELNFIKNEILAINPRR